MPITSINFALFTALALTVYYLLPRRPQNYWLLLLSYVFAVSWDGQLALVIAAITFINFGLALRLSKNRHGSRSLLWLGIGINVIVLILFRLASFFLPEMELLLGGIGLPVQTGGLQILIPIGLSYYVVQNISYLVDVYRGQLEAETDLVNFGLYLAYFPKLLAGPIERARTFLPKLSQPRVVDNQILARSLMLIVIGAIRKLLIADILAAIILSDVFEIPAKYTPPELIGWLLIYAFSIYNDFAGYTDIVRGISGLFGIELSPNFRAPYFSRNFSEFWNRWHITLSEWLRDYVYFPLSRALIRRNPSRQNTANLILPPMVTMLVSGLWHGFGLHMLIWGGLHGLYLIFERIAALRRSSAPPENQQTWRQGLAVGVTFALVILAWVPFRWELPAAIEFWEALLNWSSLTIGYRRMFFVAPILLGSIVLDYMQHRTQDEFIFLRLPRFAQAASLAVILFLIFISTGGDFQQPFVYQAF